MLTQFQWIKSDASSWAEPCYIIYHQSVLPAHFQADSSNLLRCSDLLIMACEHFLSMGAIKRKRPYNEVGSLMNTVPSCLETMSFIRPVYGFVFSVFIIPLFYVNVKANMLYICKFFLNFIINQVKFFIGQSNTT